MMVTFDEKTGVRTACQLKEKLLEALDSGECVCDLKELKHLDCAAAQLVISVMREGRTRGIKVKIRGLSPDVRRQFDYCGIRIGAKA
jgi:anti-anti-sigma factor